MEWLLGLLSYVGMRPRTRTAREWAMDLHSGWKGIGEKSKKSAKKVERNTVDENVKCRDALLIGRRRVEKETICVIGIIISWSRRAAPCAGPAITHTK